MWSRAGRIHAARTNGSATKVGAVNTLASPGNATVFRLNGEGSAGPLDLIANVQAGGSPGLWHQQVWPKLQLTASVRAAAGHRVVVFRVLDAGDPVSGAVVKAGGKPLRTARNGTATLQNAPAGRVRVTASKAGYAPATLTVR